MIGSNKNGASQAAVLIFAEFLDLLGTLREYGYFHGNVTEELTVE